MNPHLPGFQNLEGVTILLKKLSLTKQPSPKMKPLYLTLLLIFLSLNCLSQSKLDQSKKDLNKSAEKRGETVKKYPEVEALINCISIQQGPGEVLMCVKIKL